MEVMKKMMMKKTNLPQMQNLSQRLPSVERSPRLKPRRESREKM